MNPKNKNIQNVYDAHVHSLTFEEYAKTVHMNTSGDELIDLGEEFLESGERVFTEKEKNDLRGFLIWLIELDQWAY